MTERLPREALLFNRNNEKAPKELKGHQRRETGRGGLLHFDFGLSASGKIAQNTSGFMLDAARRTSKGIAQFYGGIPCRFVLQSNQQRRLAHETQPA